MIHQIIVSGGPLIIEITEIITFVSRKGVQLLESVLRAESYHLQKFKMFSTVELKPCPLRVEPSSWVDFFLDDKVHPLGHVVNSSLDLMLFVLNSVSVETSECLSMEKVSMASKEQVLNSDVVTEETSQILI